MIYEFDIETANGFAFAALALLTGDAPPPGSRPAVLFSLGLAGGAAARDGIAENAAERATSILHFEFEPGMERRGPVNVAVFHLRDDVVAIRSDCALWMPAEGPAVIASLDGAVSFRLTGDDLVAAR